MSPASVQELRGQYVRRLPTATEIATRSPIVLTPRDVEILVAVHQHGFLTTDLVELALFPPSRSVSSCNRSRSKAYERVRDLWLWGYLERVELPVARVLGGRRPFLYALGRQGVPLVEAQIGTWSLPVQPRRLDRLDHVFIDHDLKAGALWANLRAQLRQLSRGETIGDQRGRSPQTTHYTMKGVAAQRRGVPFHRETAHSLALLWVGERELRARRMRVRLGEYWAPFLPDAYFEVVYPSGDVQCVLVEIDMGTLTLRRFARKVQAFEAALDDDVFRRHFKRDEFEVLVLTTSPRRLETLRRVAARVVPGGRRDLYRLATFAALQPSAFATARWVDLDGEASTGALSAVG